MLDRRAAALSVLGSSRRARHLGGGLGLIDEDQAGGVEVRSGIEAGLPAAGKGQLLLRWRVVFEVEKTQDFAYRERHTMALTQKSECLTRMTSTCTLVAARITSLLAFRWLARPDWKSFVYSGIR